MDTTRRDLLKSSLAALAGTCLGVSLGKDGSWPETYSLMATLPQPKEYPIGERVYGPVYGIGYWIMKPQAGPFEFRHVGDGFYVAEAEGMRFRAILERRDGKIFCDKISCDT